MFDVIDRDALAASGLDESTWMHRSAFEWRLMGSGLGEFWFGRGDVPV
jgi:hypothetical protein